jgi:hypothetical protein
MRLENHQLRSNLALMLELIAKFAQERIRDLQKT